MGCLMLLMLLTACYGPQRRQMLALLDEADSLNRAYAQLPSDTLLAAAADFFDRHGTPNEQLRAHYLLGCAYRDMGEAPQAIDCYLDAAACADTTAADCDFRTLGCVYSQMGDQYHLQLLFKNEAQARKSSCHFAELAGDTVGAISSINLLAASYILQNKGDSAETAIRKAMALYEEHGYKQRSLQSSNILMHLLSSQPSRRLELKTLIDRYDNECELFDEHHDLPPSKRQYYYYKGKYFESVGQLDSAEYYYRKVNRPGMSYVSLDPMYRGLLSVFQKRHQPDSIAKYAQLFCQANDSSIIIKDQEITAQMSASYNYYRIENESRTNEARAYRMWLWLVASIVAFAVFIAFAVFSFNVYRKKHKEREARLKREHLQVERRQQMLYLQKEEELQSLHQQDLDRLTQDYKGKQDSLRLAYEQEKARLEITHQQELDALRERQQKKQCELNARKQIIDIIDQELEQTKKKAEEYRSKYSQSLPVIADLEERILLLEQQLEQATSERDLGANLERSVEYTSSEIVSKIKQTLSHAQNKMSKRDVHELVKTTARFYPQLVNDLNTIQNISQKKMCVCILTALHVSPGDIARLSDVSPSVVSNCKSELNEKLFKEGKAGTLQINLSKRYRFFPCLPLPNT